MAMAGTSGLEVRIHGIGNHKPLAALGTPANVDPMASGSARVPSPRDPEIVSPVVPGHGLWLVAWTRSARSLQGLTWLLAVPFTLVNTAGQMRPEGKAQRFAHRIAVNVLGLALTVGAYLWSVTTAEVLLLKLHLTGPLGENTYLVSAVGIAIIWLAITLVHGLGLRGNRHPDELDRRARPRAITHGVALVVVAGMVVTQLPRQITLGEAANCSVGPPGAECLVFAGDWTTVLSWATLAAAAVTTALFAIWSAARPDRDWSGGRADPLLGAGLVLFTATVCLHLLASLVQLLLDQVATYLARHYPWHTDFSLQATPFLKARDENIAPFTGSDTLVAPLLPIATVAAIVILVSLVVKAVVTHLRHRAETPVTSPSHKDRFAYSRARTVHRLVCEMSSVRVSAGLLIVLAAVGVWFWASVEWMVSLQSVSTQAEYYRLSVAQQVLWADYVVGVHSILVLLAFAWFSKSTRQTLAVLGDVAGYWPVSDHPLAGTPYRFALVDFMAERLRGVQQAIVVVGHSQGSVIAADVVLRLHQLSPEGPKPTLVTCGSPLRSLYSRFFPEQFGANHRRSIQDAVQDWGNFWRSTDPIATELGARPQDGEGPKDEQLADGTEREQLSFTTLAHGDYWLEEKQRAFVDARLAQDG